jgi:hypothetical protein
LTNQDAAQHVVNDDLQWKKMQQEMKAKGAVTSLSLKQSLIELLQERIKEMDTEKHKPVHDTTNHQNRRRSLTDSASLIARDKPNRRNSEPLVVTGHCCTARRLSFTLGRAAASLADEAYQSDNRQKTDSMDHEKNEEVPPKV